MKSRIFSVFAAAVLTFGVGTVAVSPAEAVVGRKCIGSKLTQHTLKDSGGRTLGRVELWYNNAGNLGLNCVQTISSNPGNSSQELGAFLMVGTTNNPRTAKLDEAEFDLGRYGYYAGGAWLPAGNRCVQYAGTVQVTLGGKIHTAKWRSTWGWCG